MKTIEILRELIHQLRNAQRFDTQDRLIAAGHAMIRTNHAEEIGGAGIRYLEHQHWQAACQTVLARSGQEEVFGFFPKNRCVRNSKFSGDPLMESSWFKIIEPNGRIHGFEDGGETVIGWGFPRFQKRVIAQLPGQFDLSDPDWDSVANFDGKFLTRKSGSGKTDYYMWIGADPNGIIKCIPIPLGIWDDEGKIEEYLTSFTPKGENIEVADEEESEVEDEESESEMDDDDEDEAEIIHVEGSDEVRRQVSGIWQHKHGSYDYWHPMGRVHKEEMVE
jgi:hypothetical protein